MAGKVAVVTGAGSGIGRALAGALAGRGCRLALSDVHPERLHATARSCAGLGAEVLAEVVDVADARGMADHAAHVLERFGVVHLVVNNAGVAHTGTAVDQSLDDMARIMDVNLWGVVHGTQAFLPHLIDSGDGHLVNVSSLFGLMAVPAHSAYHASKFAVRGYTESIAVEMEAGRHPVRVTCVHPGGVATSIARDGTVGPGHDRAGLIAAFDRMARTSPERAAEVILRGVARGRRRVLVGADARITWVLVSLLGSRYVPLVAWLARRTAVGAATATSLPTELDRT